MKQANSACAHEQVAYLGDNRDARFLRCGTCGVVFVLQGGVAYAIPPVKPKDAAAEGIDRKAS